MPELPEVQTIVNDLNDAQIAGVTLKSVRTGWPKSVDKALQKPFKPKTISKISRRAKFIILHLSDGGSILIHLRMAGRLNYTPKAEPSLKYERAAFLFTNGKELRLIDTRKFARIYFTRDLETFFQKYGPEPFDPAFDWRALKQLLMKRNRALKPLLLDQNFISGIGNIYADEALFLAKLHPKRRAMTLKDSEVKALHKAIRQALSQGIRLHGTTLGSGKSNYYRLDQSKGDHTNSLKVYHRTGLPCRRCGKTVQKMVIGQRSTHFCANCQK